MLKQLQTMYSALTGPAVATAILALYGVVLVTQAVAGIKIV